LADSMLRMGGGEPVRGDARDEYPLPLALLELFRLRLPFLGSRDFRIVRINEACAGEK
jgi:hypothetical protein